MAELVIGVGEMWLIIQYVHLKTVDAQYHSMSGLIFMFGIFVSSCIYTMKLDMTIEDLKKYRNLQIMGCESKAVNKVNGHVTNKLNDSVCLSNGGSCNNCL